LLVAFVINFGMGCAPPRTKGKKVKEARQMKFLKKKTTKAFRKALRKIVNKHGPELAAALAGGALLDKVSHALTADDRQGSRKADAGGKKAKKKSKRRVKSSDLSTAEPTT
jgi:hypothetical protein